MRERERNVLNNPRGCLFLFLYSPPAPTPTPRGHCCYAILVERIVEDRAALSRRRETCRRRRRPLVFARCARHHSFPHRGRDRRAISPLFLQKGCRVKLYRNRAATLGEFLLLSLSSPRSLSPLGAALFNNSWARLVWLPSLPISLPATVGRSPPLPTCLPCQGSHPLPL